MYVTFTQHMLLIIYVFFFQAEDGIRDYKVTGVQTCALPICGFRPLRQSGIPSQRIKDATTLEISVVAGRGYVVLGALAETAPARKFEHPKGLQCHYTFGRGALRLQGLRRSQIANHKGVIARIDSRDVIPRENDDILFEWRFHGFERLETIGAHDFSELHPSHQVLSWRKRTDGIAEAAILRSHNADLSKQSLRWRSFDSAAQHTCIAEHITDLRNSPLHLLFLLLISATDLNDYGGNIPLERH